MTTNLNLTSKPSFGGQEKFVFRDGWLKKGVDAVSAEPGIFSDDQALVVLGVGKNMVRSIRHWCLATGVCEESDGPDRKRSIGVSSFGRQLMIDGGWDPFVEDSSTLWILHWQLTENLQRSLVWHIIFARFYDVEFTKLQLGQFLTKQFERLGVTTTSGMIAREIDCFVRTYAPTRAHSGKINEETLDCPLTELDLIRFVAQDNVYRFNIGAKPTLPDAVFSYALLHYLDRIAQHRRTVAVDECVYGEGSPGQVFRMDENSVVERLEKLAELTNGQIRLQESAGLNQLYISTEQSGLLRDTAERLLEDYYARN